MGMRWEKWDRGSWHAYSGQHLIGMVVPVPITGDVVWSIDAVTGSKHQAATRGRSSTVPNAKRAFRRAWRVWLAERGLQEAP